MKAIVFGLLLISTSVFADDESAFDILQLPEGASVTLPSPATTLVPVSTSYRLNPTDKSQVFRISSPAEACAVKVQFYDKETTETALMAAETGHLVLSTLHTLDATESITRLMSYFPPHQHTSLRMMLSQTLKAIVSQRLVARIDGKGMVPALEILIANEVAKETILKADNFDVLKDTIRNSRNTYGMQSFDQSLLALYNNGVISAAEALNNASKRKDLELAMQGFES